MYNLFNIKHKDLSLYVQSNPGYVFILFISQFECYGSKCHCPNRKYII